MRRVPLWKTPSPRQDDELWHDLRAEWWSKSAAATGAKTVAMGSLPYLLDKPPRGAKTPGALYFTQTVNQANLYCPGSNWATVEEVEKRLRACPLLAAGSIEAPVKPEGGHRSEYNVKFRTILNFSLEIGWSMHGDKWRKNDKESTVAHGWVKFCDGCNTIEDKRRATEFMCGCFGYEYVRPEPAAGGDWESVPIAKWNEQIPPVQFPILELGVDPFDLRTWPQAPGQALPASGGAASSSGPPPPPPVQPAPSETQARVPDRQPLAPAPVLVESPAVGIDGKQPPAPKPQPTGTQPLAPVSTSGGLLGQAKPPAPPPPGGPALSTVAANVALFEAKGGQPLAPPRAYQ